MTVSISASVGSNHQGRTFAQRKKWVPDHDDGSTFTPGHWEDDGEAEEIAPGGSFHYGFADSDGYSVTVWSESADAGEDESDAEQQSGD